MFHRYGIFIAALTFSLKLSAQSYKPVQIEQLRCYSAMGPVMRYLKDADIRAKIAAQLNQSLQKNFSCQLTDTTNIPVKFLENAEMISDVQVDINKQDTSLRHLYIDFFEANPDNYFSAPQNSISDTAMMVRAEAVWIFRYWLIDYHKDILSQGSLNVVLSKNLSIGTGVPFKDIPGYGTLVVSPAAFSDVWRYTGAILFNPQNSLAVVEMKTSPVYLLDNYLLPYVAEKEPYLAEEQKGVWVYRHGNEREVLRLEDPLYREMQVFGRKADTFPDELSQALKDTRDARSSTFLYLRQMGRDVVRDKTYMLQLITQVNPMDRLPKEKAFTHFLSGNFHCLLAGNDTLALFSIDQQQDAPGKWITPAVITNGKDSNVAYTILPGVRPQTVSYNYVITGKIGAHLFAIRLSGPHNEIKEILLDGHLSAVVSGEKRPEKITPVQPSLSFDILNPLIMIAFSSFFT